MTILAPKVVSESRVPPRCWGARSLIVVQPEKTKLSPSLDFMALGTLPVSPIGSLTSL